MSTIKYGETVGVFSEDGKFRLDIGTDATKKTIPAAHNSWATRLKIKRLDGENSGVISDRHVVGIFSEDGKFRLDIGTDAMKKNVPAKHISWATRLVIKRLDGASSGEVCYGHVVGIFSENEKYRLDIGTDAMKTTVPAAHNSWATRLRIQDPDPIKDVVISQIVYDVKNANTLGSGPAELYRQTLMNGSSVPQTNSISGSVSISETSGWSDSLGFKIGVKTSFNTGIPYVADGKVDVSAEISNTYTWNGSTTKTKTWGFNSPVTVPPYTVINAIVSATVSTIAVPYTLKGTFVHESGARVPGDIKGIYTGSNSHDLTITYIEQDPVTSKIKTRIQSIKGVPNFSLLQTGEDIKGGERTR